MTPEKQRIAIAEICGWSNIHQLENSNTLMGWWSGRPKASLVIPNYPCSLDAMHEAEEILITRGGLPTYQYFLRLNEIKENSKPWYGEIYAEAEEKAEAFLKTFGKWED